MQQKHAEAPSSKERRSQINLLCTAVAAVGLEFSTAHNALYGLIDAVEMIVRMLSRQSCAGAASEELRESRKRAPTADWLLMKVRGVRPEEMDRRLRRMLRRDVRRAMSAGAVARRPVVAIDKTYIARYSRKAPAGQLVCRCMPGTNKAEAYMSAKAVGGPAPLHVACRHVPRAGRWTHPCADPPPSCATAACGPARSRPTGSSARPPGCGSPGAWARSTSCR